MPTFQLNLAHLKACVLAASTEETRYYLRGVNVEFLPDRTIYTATNGHILFCSTHEANNAPGIETQIICMDSIKQIKINRNAAPLVDCELNNRKIGSADMDYLLNVIDGTFPDWRRILPQAGDDVGKAGHFAFNLLAKFEAIHKALSADMDLGDKPWLSFNGAGNPTFINFGSADCFGVIMPIRKSEGMTKRPDWVDAVPAESVQQAAE